MGTFSLFRSAAALALLFAAACANNDYEQIRAKSAAALGAGLHDYHVAKVDVRFAPDAYLEWCEDDLLQCDLVEMRIAQTFEFGAHAGARRALSGARPATLIVDVTHFDSITLLTRFTFGGVHDINASFTLADAKTGDVIAPATPLDFDRIAWGRTAAIVARLAGRTQRVRIAERIGEVTEAWLNAVGGRVADRRGQENAIASKGREPRLSGG